jgi:NAD(P)-dependent dehydrogenase (short-subunit alcohol dehydrogenase family)
VPTPTRPSRSSRRAKLPEGVIAVTGAASGIGAACAARFSAAGYRVIGVDLHDTEVVADLGTTEGRAEAMAAITESSGGTLAGLVTCAGWAGAPWRPGSLLAAVNYFGSIELLAGLLPGAGSGGGSGGAGRGGGSPGGGTGRGGAAVAISSNSTTVQPDIPMEVVEACLAHHEERARAGADEVGSLRTYPATKLAVAYWVRRQATGADWAGSGIRLNAVAPGMIETPMITDMRSDPDVGPLLAMLPIPVGRTGRPEEIAALIEFLIGPEGGYFCGSVLFCDGGSDALLRPDDAPAPWDLSPRDFGKDLSA